MTGATTSLRLLPWVRAEGKPCYLSTDHAGGYVSRVADDMEEAQLGTGTDLPGHAADMPADPKASTSELRYLTARLTETRPRRRPGCGDRLDLGLQPHHLVRLT